MKNTHSEDKANTPDEIIDLVDRDDRVIGETTKGKANADPKLIHREVAIIIYNRRNQVLFQQRSFKKKVGPGRWVISCAGHIPKGISPKQAAHMELKEELGFNTDLKFIEKKLMKHPNETHFAYWYVGKYPDDVKITAEPEEIEKVQFFSENKLTGLLKEGADVSRVSANMAKRFWRKDF